MGFKDQVRNEVEEANTGNNGGDNEREELEQIDVDMSNIPFIKFTPTTLVAGTIPKDEGNPIILFKNYNRLNADDFDAFDEEGNDMRYVSTRYLGIVVDNPRVVTSEEDGLDESVFVETGSDDSTRTGQSTTPLRGRTRSSVVRVSPSTETPTKSRERPRRLRDVLSSS